MLAVSNQYKSNIIPLQDEIDLRPGTRVGYLRDGKAYTGTLLAVIITRVKRYKVDGDHPLVTEYAIEPDPEQTNLSLHVASVVWAVES